MPAQLIMGLAILAFFLGKAIPGIKDRNPTFLFLSVLTVCFLIEITGQGSETLFFDMVKVDSFSRLFNQVFLGVLVITVLMIAQSNEIDRRLDWETYGLLSTIGLGMMLMASSINILIAVISIELVSLPSYVLVAMNPRNVASKEASLKYVLFGSFATGIMLYGMSLIYGLTGSLKFDEIWKGLAIEGIVGSPIYLLAVVMSLAGMVFKIAAAPFHFWCPDAYQAAPTPVTAFLSVAPKVAGLALIMRFFADQVSSQTEQLSSIISVIAMVTMTVGNLAALHQKDIKRMLAYSSISHAGFLLIGVAVMNQDGREAILFYIPIYLLMNLGAFMAVIYLSKGDEFQIDSFKGIIKEKPLLVVGLGVCMLSLAGLPPFAGFIGKFYLFKVAIESNLYLLVLIAGINSVISLWYYVNVLKVMVIDETDPASQGLQLPTGTVPVTFVTVCALPLLLFGIYWVPLLNWVAQIQIFY
ncbi:MAG: NADH-quinone oxidoreductase subunit N [Proteobacteria bacterium]|nr:NADH-quinone oxidoreductase subunit N [Pseudomonadota bacterium]